MQLKHAQLLQCFVIYIIFKIMYNLLYPRHCSHCFRHVGNNYQCWGKLQNNAILQYYDIALFPQKVTNCGT